MRRRAGVLMAVWGLFLVPCSAPSQDGWQAGETVHGGAISAGMGCPYGGNPALVGYAGALSYPNYVYVDTTITNTRNYMEVQAWASSGAAGDDAYWLKGWSYIGAPPVPYRAVSSRK